MNVEANLITMERIAVKHGSESVISQFYLHFLIQYVSMSSFLLYLNLSLKNGEFIKKTLIYNNVWTFWITSCLANNLKFLI